jgi:hypothetical protein
MSSAIEGLATHIKDCNRVSNEVKEKMASETSDLERTPKRNRKATQFSTSHASLGYGLPPGVGHGMYRAEPASMEVDQPPSPTSHLSSTFPSSSVFPSASASQTGTPSPLTQSLSRESSLSVKRQRTRTISRTHSMPDIHKGQWTTQDQADFENHLIRMTASADFSFSWVENPEWLSFVERFIPLANSPSRKVLSTRILDTNLEKTRTLARSVAKGSFVTLQADGWTGLNTHHLVAFMMTTGSKVCLEFNTFVYPCTY